MISKFLVSFLALGLVGSQFAQGIDRMPYLDKECVEVKVTSLKGALSTINTAEGRAILDVADAEAGPDEADDKFSLSDMHIMSRTRTVKAELREAAKVLREPGSFYLLDVVDENWKNRFTTDNLAGMDNLNQVHKQLDEPESFVRTHIRRTCMK